MKYSTWTSISSYLVENLKKRIASGEFPPESKLPSEKKIMEEYSVGRSSVREALRMLQAENLIRIEQGRGSFVLSDKLRRTEMHRWYKSKSETFTDLIELREALELLAVRRATKFISPEEIQQLKQINAAFGEEKNASDYALLQSYDEKFHQTIVHAARMELLEDFFDIFERAYAEYRVKGFVFTQYIQYAAIGHDRIIRNLEARDEAGAELEMRLHIHRVVNDIEAILQLSGD